MLPSSLTKANANSTQDIKAATQIAYQMVTQLGMSDVLGNMDFASSYQYLSSETKLKIEQEVTRIVEEAKSRATTLLTEKRKELDIVAEALVEYETLSLDEINKVLKGEKLDKIATATLLPAALKLPEIVLPPGMGGDSSPSTSARYVDQGPDTRRGDGSGGAE